MLMSEEFKTPDDSDELVISEKKDVKIDAIDTKEVEGREGDLLAKMIQIAKSFNGYRCISVSRMTSFVDSDKVPPGTTSALARRLLVGYVLKRGGTPEEFKKLFVNTPIAYIQCHAGEPGDDLSLPIMAKDGLYDALDGNFHVMTTQCAGEVVLSDPDNFEPFILVKLEGKDNFGIVKGNPYHTVTKEEADAVLKMNLSPDSEANA